MIVKSVSMSLIPWKQSIVVEAIEHEEVSFGNLLGDRCYWVDEGDRYRISVPRSWCVEVGDDLYLGPLVQLDQDQFKWQWDD